VAITEVQKWLKCCVNPTAAPQKHHTALHLLQAAIFRFNPAAAAAAAERRLALPACC
jgi:hypothetical protein